MRAKINIENPNGAKILYMQSLRNISLSFRNHDGVMNSHFI